MKKPFAPTHVIKHGDQSVLVAYVGARLYTRAEWEADPIEWHKHEWQGLPSKVSSRLGQPVEATIERVPRAVLAPADPRSQVEQLHEIIVMANQLGLYAASDWIQTHLPEGDKLSDAELVLRVFDGVR